MIRHYFELKYSMWFLWCVPIDIYIIFLDRLKHSSYLSFHIEEPSYKYYLTHNSSFTIMFSSLFMTSLYLYTIRSVPLYWKYTFAYFITAHPEVNQVWILGLLILFFLPEITLQLGLILLSWSLESFLWFRSLI